MRNIGLEFPQIFQPQDDLGDPNGVIGWLGGFDAVLGNPPWERIKLQEKEWFASRDEIIATAPNAAARRKLIAALPKTNPTLFTAFEADKRKAEGESHFVRNSSKYPLCGRGDVNTYAIFAELNRGLLAETGRAGFIIQSDIATADTYKYFFADLLDNKQLVSFYDFVNTEGLFPHVHRTHPHFCLITLSGGATTDLADFAFWNTNTGHLHDENRHFTLSVADLALLNPNTRNCPIFRSKRDAELTKAIYRRVPALLKEGPPEENPWDIRFFTMFHMSNDSGLFRTRERLVEEGWQLQGNRFVRDDEVYLPLYEGKLIWHFDHRYSTFDQANNETRDVTEAEHTDPSFQVLPRYWTPQIDVSARLSGEKWFVGFRDISNTTNERTAIWTIIPESGVSNKYPLLLNSLESPKLITSFSANFQHFLTPFLISYY